MSLRELVLHRGMSVRCVERRVNVINNWGCSYPLSPFGRSNPQPLFLNVWYLLLMDSLIERYMNLRNLDYKIKVIKTYYDGPRATICVQIVVHEKDSLEIQFNEYHCYRLILPVWSGKSGLSLNDVKFAEGNRVKSAGEGSLLYLGNNDMVENYFSEKTRQFAFDYFEKLL